MTVDVDAMADGGQARRVRSGAGWEELMAASGRRDGPQASFRQGRGVPVRTSRSWRRRRGLTGGAASGGSGGAVAAEPGWDGGLSPGGGVTLRLRRSRCRADGRRAASGWRAGRRTCAAAPPGPSGWSPAIPWGTPPAGAGICPAAGGGRW